ncbi:hypothetical protein OGM63_15665 [Plectonema radiosum NIES-515]|uniref:Uncharacterized protein n=1 Tax=Plectonema radiosum NIES-515 TaxID=2986073 RepID=A0ABT3B0N4_9CYAN|nr:hypothetical protein [Plectonema radiosum]MCV3214933.1 hypothetical protein [Plectonema radiosum NIES-515]
MRQPNPKRREISRHNNCFPRRKSIPFGSKCEAELDESGFTIPDKMSAGWWFGTEQYAEFFQATIERVEFS